MRVRCAHRMARCLRDPWRAWISQFPPILLALLLLTAMVCPAGCASLPSNQGRSQSVALPASQTAATRLGQRLREAVARHPDLSGLLLLGDSAGSLAARIELADAADRTLDLQYYIWHNDESGRLLMDTVRRAADRGVRVRMLLDDNGIAGLDPMLVNLDRHPNIEVRLFNPFMQRRMRWVGFLTDFDRLNHRMHNKSMTADNQVTIVGGRNVGDEYFGRDRALDYFDLDVLAIGNVVEQVSTDFDRYWASESAYPLSRILGEGHRSEPPPIRTPGIDVAGRVQRTSSYVARLSHDVGVEWAAARVISDDPAKALGHAARGSLLLDKLRRTLPLPRYRWYVVSAYFVPSYETIHMFTTLADRGVRIHVLTNSAAATDVALVHAGYTRSRRALLESGIDLYELKAQSSRSGGAERHNGLRANLGMLTGSRASASSSLHEKTFATDGSTVFIGSFNFDPRSAWTNTEIGLVIESSSMARTLESRFDKEFPQNAYRVRLDDEGRMYWDEQIDRAGSIALERHDREPNIGWGLRALEWVVDVFPIRGLL